MELYVLKEYWKEPRHVITTIQKDDIEYIHRILHEKLDDEGCWSIQEENALDLVDLLYDELKQS